MRRVVTFAVVWLAAATVGVGIAWQGIGMVTSQVTDERPDALAADEVRELATAPTAIAPGVEPLPLSSSTTVAASSPPPTTATVAPQPPAAESDVGAETRTYTVVGGSVALRFTAAGVSVVWATPNSGFDVDVEPEHVNGVRVEFESDSHRSRVDGWWSSGPNDRVREDAND